MYTAIVVAGLLAVSAIAVAADDAPGAWMQGSMSGRFGDDEDAKWLYTVDAQARYFDVGSGINQWLVRPAVGYSPGDRSRVWVGYARYRSRDRAGVFADEDRFWQQLDWKAGRFGGGDLSLRLRLEQRDISSASDTRHVARLRAKYVRPLGTRAPQSLLLSIEPFFDLNTSDWGGSSGLSQSRVYVGLDWRLGRRTVMETGYMNQHFHVSSRPDRVNHLAILGFRVTLD
jgi:hypothetical protein